MYRQGRAFGMSRYYVQKKAFEDCDFSNCMCAGLALMPATDLEIQKEFFDRPLTKKLRLNEGDSKFFNLVENRVSAYPT